MNYPAHKLEFLALKWAVTDKFHEYLYGNQFEVKTDNNPLTYVLTSAKLDATGHRWLAALSTYNFKITYRAGINNQDADALSRDIQLSRRVCPSMRQRYKPSARSSTLHVHLWNVCRVM
jgi:hypothetical protein